MRRLRYSVVISLDGFIARLDGSFDWIPDDPTIDFAALYAEFDTLLMGRKTWDVLRAQQPYGPAEAMQKIVVSRHHPPGTEGRITFIDALPSGYVRKLKEQPGKDIWLFGGGEVFGQLLAAGLVDSVEVAIMPVLLGAGIPLLGGGPTTARLRLIRCQQRPSGIVMLEYAVVSDTKPEAAVGVQAD